MSTNAIKPFGNAIANDTIAASSPSLASAVLIFKTLVKFFRWLMASSSMSAVAPVAFLYQGFFYELFILLVEMLWKGKAIINRILYLYRHDEVILDLRVHQSPRMMLCKHVHAFL